MVLRRMLVVPLVAVTALFTTAIAANAAGPQNNAPQSSTCNGPIAPGTYSSLTVTGFCFLTPGTFTVTSGLTVAPNAALDASGCNAHITISGGVRVSTGGVLFLGGSVNGTGCAADTNDVVRGGLSATGSLAVVVHGTRIDGGFSVLGGGGGTSCENVPGLPFPPFTDIEDSSVNGGATIAGLSTCWMGFIRNQVNGGVHVDNNTMGDPDAIEIGLNMIHGPLACSGNQLDPAIGGPGGVPTNSFDGSPANPNTVSGPETGQCKGL